MEITERSSEPAPRPVRPQAAGVSVTRSLLLMAAGAAVGLILAGYALFTARGTSTLHVPAEDVALVNQQPISRTDYIAQINTLYSVDLAHASAAERTRVLEDMIREELFVQRAKELDLASTDPEVRAAMVNAVELEIAATAITEQPTEAALRAYYTAHRERYASEGTMTVRDFIFKPDRMADAEQAAERFKLAAPDAALRDPMHAGESTQSGDEQFYFAAKIHLGQRLFDVARHMVDGGVSPPIREAGSLHVLYMVKNQTPVPMEFGAARDQVLNDYRTSAIAHLRSGDEVFLRKRANVQIADDLR